MIFSFNCLSLVFIFPFPIRFWQKGGTGVEDSIVKQALLLSINLHSNGNTTFYSNIMESSKSYNLPNFVPNNLDKTKISRYKDIMKQKYITQWRHSVNYTRKLEFYNTFKHCYEISSYLNLTRKTINRKALVKLRVNNHKLMIETGRYNQTPHDKRLCPARGGTPI